MTGTAARSPPGLLVSTATMAMDACRCSNAVRLSVALSAVKPAHSAAVRSSSSRSGPAVEYGGLDHTTARLLLERPVQVSRHTDVNENLRTPASGRDGAVGIAGWGGADGCRSGTQDGGDRSGIDLNVTLKPVHRNAVLDPAEKLLDGNTRAAKTRYTAHACGIGPDCFFKLHGTIRACCDNRLHGGSPAQARTDSGQHAPGSGGVQ